MVTLLHASGDRAVSFERWELAILNRIAEHILPFETTEGRNFLTRFYNYLDRQSKETQYVRLTGSTSPWALPIILTR